MKSWPLPPLPCLLAFALGGAVPPAQAAEAGRTFVGTSAFILVNLVPGQENPPDFFQLNLGYRLTHRDVFSLEAVTWKYNAPLGIPYGPSFDDPDEAYPGHIRDFGLGIAYQRFLWKGLYAGTHALPLLHKYVESATDTEQFGFMLFLTFRLGYHLEFFRNRFFIQPSVAGNWWPITTHSPKAFSAVEARWPDYFLFEPGLHLGLAF